MEYFRFNSSRLKHPLMYAALVFAVFVLLAFFIYFWVRDYNAGEAKQRFQGNAALVEGEIKRRLESQVPLLFGARGLFSASESVKRSEWASYFSGFDSAGLFREISTIVFVEIVKSDEKDSFISGVRGDISVFGTGFPDFRIFPESEKDEYFVVKYVEPHDEDRLKTVGFDLGSEPVRLEAVTRARFSEGAVMSGIFSSQVTGEKSFALVLPVYENGPAANGANERKKNLAGFVYAVFRIPVFFENVLTVDHETNDGLEFVLYDGGLSAEPFYSHTHEKSESGGVLRERRMIEFGGRSWTIEFFAPDMFGLSPLQKNSCLFAFLGTLFTGIVASALVYTFRIKWDKDSETLFQARELEAIIDNAPVGIYTINAAGYIEMFNPKMAEISGTEKTQDRVGLNVFTDLPVYKETGIDEIIRQGLSGKKLGGEFFYKSLTGKETWRRYSVVPLFAKDGKTTEHLLLLVEDVTRQKHLEEQLQKYVGTLEKEVAGQTKDLQVKIRDLEHLNKTMIGRELKMAELKKEIDELKNKLKNK